MARGSSHKSMAMMETVIGLAVVVILPLIVMRVFNAPPKAFMIFVLLWIFLLASFIS